MKLTEKQMYDAIYKMVNEAIVEEGFYGDMAKGVASEIGNSTKRGIQNIGDKTKSAIGKAKKAGFDAMEVGLQKYAPNLYKAGVNRAAEGQVQTAIRTLSTIVGMSESCIDNGDFHMGPMITLDDTDRKILTAAVYILNNINKKDATNESLVRRVTEGVIRKLNELRYQRTLDYLAFEDMIGDSRLRLHPFEVVDMIETHFPKVWILKDFKYMLIRKYNIDTHDSYGPHLRINTCSPLQKFSEKIINGDMEIIKSMDEFLREKYYADERRSLINDTLERYLSDKGILYREKF